VSEEGSILPFAALVMALALVVALVVVALAARAVERADAQTAADAAALAGVFEGEAGAADVAHRNGAALVTFETTGAGVHVVVRVGAVEAEAFAVHDWGDLEG
jgi:uncharacterized membrane protein